MFSLRLSIKFFSLPKCRRFSTAVVLRVTTSSSPRCTPVGLLPHKPCAPPLGTASLCALGTSVVRLVLFGPYFQVYNRTKVKILYRCCPLRCLCVSTHQRCPTPSLLTPHSRLPLPQRKGPVLSQDLDLPTPTLRSPYLRCRDLTGGIVPTQTIHLKGSYVFIFFNGD